MGRDSYSNGSSVSHSSDSKGDRRGGGRKRDRSPARYQSYNNGGRTYPRCPREMACQVCKKKNHWTVECDMLHRADPSDPRYAHIDIRNGCPICGKVGHDWERCRNIKYLCEGCGDLHATRECPYDYEPIEYHEFFDSVKGYPYYYCTKDRSISWVYKGKPQLDKLLWHCDTCRVLTPAAVPECVFCHADRRTRESVTKPAVVAVEKPPTPAPVLLPPPTEAEVEKKLLDEEAALLERSRHATEQADGLTFNAISNWIDDTAYSNSY